ncbi:MAG: rhodanese-related sulfurtransferase [Ignavibacteriaceae bacterium]|nr:rhodanese-related sulfurtransferase [Ignavibacteriaceae bacterium]
MEAHFLIISFYKYVNIPEPEVLREEILDYCITTGLRGKIYLANEGINASVSGTVELISGFKNYLESFPYFKNILFKEDTTEGFVFDKMHVRVKRELVHLGVSGISLENGGKRLKPEDLNNFYETGKDFIIIDTRNSWESNIGHFKNAVLPEMHTFRDWEKAVDDLSNFKDKTVVTYCTGGIRCEKASALMVEKGFKDVYQLDGGIITYLKQFPKSNWEGGCFVFDNRRLIETNDNYVANCSHCGKPTAKYINCHNLDCDKLFVCCEECRHTHEYSCSEECRKSERRRDKNYD